jgi:hypothetical protein
MNGSRPGNFSVFEPFPSERGEGSVSMKMRILVMVALCAMCLGVLTLAGCSSDEEGVKPASLLILGAGQSAYFPEIPKGVAE